MDKNQILDYVMNSPRNTNRAVLSGMLNGLNDGGASWTVLTEETVTTVSEDDSNLGELAYKFTNTPPEKLKVTFDGIVYECDVMTSGMYIYGGFNEGALDFSEYPFVILAGNPAGIFTETAGAHTIKIEAPQSGDSSDLSTAEITVVGDGEIIGAFLATLPLDPPIESTCAENSLSNTIILYKGHAAINAFGIVGSISGNIQDFGDGAYLVTGDCTITFGDKEPAE